MQAEIGEELAAPARAYSRERGQYLSSPFLDLLAEAQGNTPKDIAEVLKTKFVADVQKDLGYIVDEANPETILKFTVTTFDAEVRPGTHQSGSNTVPFTLLNDNVEVSYQVLEARSNAPLDSENLVESFKKEYSSPVNPDSVALRKIPILRGIPTTKSTGSSAAPSQSELRSWILRRTSIRRTLYSMDKCFSHFQHRTDA